MIASRDPQPRAQATPVFGLTKAQLQPIVDNTGAWTVQKTSKRAEEYTARICTKI